MAAVEAQVASKRGEWTGQVGFILSAIGSAVGLGNIWRFPGVAYESGGGAFLIPYLIALLTAGIPILFLDYAIGHRFKGSPPLALRRVAGFLGESIGWFQVMICVFIAIYYTVVLAWSSSFFVYSFDLRWGGDAPGFFTGDYLQVPTDGSLFSTAFVPSVLVPLAIMWIVTLAVLRAGVAKGVQRVNIVAIPLLVVGFLILVVRALFLPGASEGLNALFTPDLSALGDPSVWVAAYSQIFFSLSVGFGIMMTYSSYRKRRTNLTSPGLIIAFGNSSFEILAGIGVFSTLGFFAHQQGVAVSELEGLTGVTLAFMTFPAIISEMPGGQFFGLLFFGSLTLAGLTSLISILEVIFAGFIDKFGLTRAQAVYRLGIPLALVSVALFGTATGLFALDTIDNWVNSLGIVGAAIAMTITVMWVQRSGPELFTHLSELSTFKVKWGWWVLVSVLSPVVLTYMLLSAIGALIAEPYGGYSTGYLLIFGWGVIAAMIVGAGILTATKWRTDPMKFEVWPPYSPSYTALSQTHTDHGGARVTSAASTSEGEQK